MAVITEGEEMKMGAQGAGLTAGKAIVFIGAIFSLCILLSVVFQLQSIHRHTREKALTEDRTLFALNLAYRRWNAGHGGVYVPVTAKYQPNPYLQMHQKRDLTATDGTPLTLVNPAMMTRDVHTILSASATLPIVNKVTSLKYLNPANAPDGWETEALKSFDQGRDEVSGMVEINGAPYMRMLKPYVTERGCLACHASQGYKLGDVRGGLSVAVPMQPYFEEEGDEVRKTLVSHLLLWLIGMAGIVLLGVLLRRAEQQIQADASLWKSTFDAIKDGILLLDTDNRILLCNTATADLTKRPLAQIVGHHCWEIMHAEQGAIESCPGRRVMRSGKRESAVMELHGGVFQVSADPICDASGALQRVVHILSDITEQHRLEEQLRQAQKMEAIGALAGGVAHDFNNILTAIYGYVEIAKREVDAEKRLSELDQVFKAASRAGELIKQILTFSRKAEQRKESLQLSLIVKEALKLLRSTIPTTIEIKQNVVSQANVLADPTQVHQVLMNLCTNAVHAMRETGGILSVSLQEVAIRPDDMTLGVELSVGNYVILEVSDTGCGMDKGTLAKIFEPYFTTKQKGEGTGLGLAVVYGIVKEHGGRISVYSEPGKGATFRVYLPVLEVAAPTVGHVADEEVVGGNERILYADDEETIRDLAALFLGEAGYQATFFGNGADALRALEQDPQGYDLLITDMAMPGMSGKELAIKAMAIRPDLPVILSTGFSEIIDGKSAKEIGITSFLQKPVIRHTLLCEIRKILDAKRR